MTWSTKIGSKGLRNKQRAKPKNGPGKATGDKKTEVEGKADQVKGKVQKAVGGVKERAIPDLIRNASASWRGHQFTSAEAR